MLADLPAHVLRLDHAPAYRAAATITCNGRVLCAQGDVIAPLPIREGSRIRVLLGLDPCRLCAGTRRSPDTGLPCEVCTVVGGSTYPVIP